MPEGYHYSITVSLGFAKFNSFMTSLSYEVGAASFTPLFRIDQPYGEKTITVSYDGQVVMARRAGGGHLETQVWTHGIIATYPRVDFVSYVLLGNGEVVSGAYLIDASYDGSVKLSRQNWIATGITPHAISADGSTVVGRKSGQDFTAPWLAYRRINGGDFERLGTLQGALQEGSEAFDVSEDGKTIVGWSTSQTRYKRLLYRQSRVGCSAWETLVELKEGTQLPSQYLQTQVLWSELAQI